MKKTYIVPNFEAVKFDTQDIIMTSIQVAEKPNNMFGNMEVDIIGAKTFEELFK